MTIIIIIIIIIIIEMMDYLILENHSVTMTPSIKCVCSCDQKPYLHNETKRRICIKIEGKTTKAVGDKCSHKHN